MAVKFVNKTENDVTRERVQRYFDRFGTTSKFFAKHAGVTLPNFVQFRNNKMDLGGYSIEKINVYINQMAGGDF